MGNTDAQTDNKVSLYAELKAAGLEMQNHESDLYVLVSETSTAILEKHPLEKKNSSRFISKADGLYYYDVPFAYEPFWDKKQKIADSVNERKSPSPKP